MLILSVLHAVMLNNTRPVALYRNLSQFNKNSMIYRGKMFAIKCTFGYCVTILSENSLFPRRIHGDIIKYARRSLYSGTVTVVRF